METKLQRSLLTQAVYDISQATQGGRKQPLIKESHGKHFVTSGSWALEAGVSRRLKLKLQQEVCRTFKQMAGEVGSKGVSLPTLPILLLKSEILSENLFKKNVYLKVNGMASDS